MKKNFSEAKIELVELSVSDIITTSIDNDVPFPGHDDEIEY